ncbi:MAG: protein translocase subunit SecF [Mycobacterium sp.]|nr:protein translocase subunit SecF [Mycobacterium sp.]
MTDTDDIALDTTTADATAPKHGFFNKLFTGTGGFEVVGRRKLWFTVTGVVLLVAIASIVLKGFTFGIDFEGGTKVSFPREGATGQANVSQVEETFTKALGFAPEAVVTVGNGATATVQIRSAALNNDQTEKLRVALFDQFQPKGVDGQPSKQAISDSAVSETWGGQITKKALIALVVFLVLVTVYITLRYERYMALSALAALFFDVTVTAGVYSLVGFEVTPATVIGLLTILGYSLYDTVIIFDKVQENTKGFEHTTRRTFAEHANLAMNQTFMRSINTSIISIMPIVSLMIVAVWLLGVGTLKDLALVQMVGILVGRYSSIFFATPLLVSLRERTEIVRNHTRKVLKRRKQAAAGELPDVEAEASLIPDGTTAPARPNRPSGKRGSRA